MPATQDTTVAIVPSPPIRLHASLGDHNEATLEVFWCITPQIAQQLRDSHAGSPHVLLVITHNNIEVGRYLEPITNGSRYVQFRRPGKSTIHATVVWSVDDDDRTLPNFFLSKSKRDVYSRVLLTHTGDELQENWQETQIKRLPGEDQRDVVVPPEMFAKQPPRWFKKYVNWFYSSPPVDQCAFRKRAIPVVLFTPIIAAATLVVCSIVFPIYYGCLILATIGLLCAGKRNINYAPYNIENFDDWVKGLGSDLGPSIWFKRWDGESYSLRHPILLAANPPLLVVLTSGLLVLHHYTSYAGGSPWWMVVLLGVGVPFAIGAIITLFFTETIHNRWQRHVERRRANQLRSLRERELQILAQLNAVVCETGDEEELAVLTRRPRTLYLRFWALKAKVCRPFAS